VCCEVASTHVPWLCVVELLTRSARSCANADSYASGTPLNGSTDPESDIELRAAATINEMKEKYP